MNKYSIFSKIILLTILIITFGSITYSVNADMGPKPSITITIENMPSPKYILDILVYDETGKNYNSKMNYNGEGLTTQQIKTLHKINYNGWISPSTRWDNYLLFSDCAGNPSYTHHFSYFGTPETYKILIITDDGDTRISDVINRTTFDSEVTIDFNTMKTNSPIDISYIFISIIPLFLTIIIEIIIAWIFKISHIKIILLANIFTNVILQVLLYYTTYYLLTFVILEILILIVEYLIYKKYLTDISKNNLLLYTLLANLCTAILTFLI